MAEGFAKELGKGLIEPFSAGLLSAGVHPRAKEVMKEVGIDIAAQTSQVIDEKELRGMDIIITLCSHAEESCPLTPPEIRRIHWPVRDPVGFIGTDEETMSDFRRAREEIREKIEKFIEDLKFGSER
jgi:arsenate reductase